MTSNHFVLHLKFSQEGKYYFGWQAEIALNWNSFCAELLLTLSFQLAVLWVFSSVLQVEEGCKVRGGKNEIRSPASSWRNSKGLKCHSVFVSLSIFWLSGPLVTCKLHLTLEKGLNNVKSLSISNYYQKLACWISSSVGDTVVQLYLEFFARRNMMFMSLVFSCLFQDPLRVPFANMILHLCTFFIGLQIHITSKFTMWGSSNAGYIPFVVTKAIFSPATGLHLFPAHECVVYSHRVSGLLSLTVPCLPSCIPHLCFSAALDVCWIRGTAIRAKPSARELQAGEKFRQSLDDNLQIQCKPCGLFLATQQLVAGQCAYPGVRASGLVWKIQRWKHPELSCSELLGLCFVSRTDGMMRR